MIFGYLIFHKFMYGNWHSQGNYNATYRLSWELYTDQDEDSYKRTDRNENVVRDTELFQLRDSFQVLKKKLSIDSSIKVIRIMLLHLPILCCGNYI